MNNKRILLLLVVLFYSSASCVFKQTETYENEVSEREKAEIITKKFYRLIEDGKNDEITNLFTINFFENSSKEDFKKFLLKKDKSFGKLNKIVLKDWKTKRSVGVENNSDYLLIYIVNYKNIISEEKISLVEEKGKIKIYSYDIKEVGTP